MTILSCHFTDVSVSVANLGETDSVSMQVRID